MSKENVEIVRQVYECVNQRRWDRMAELLDPDVAQYGTVGGVEEGSVVRGPKTAAVVDLRNGLVVRIQGYMDRAAALRAAGL